MKIALVTTTRADWGLLQPLAEELRRRPGVELQIISSNMHLMAQYGMTVKEIEQAGFGVAQRVELAMRPDTEAGRARTGADAMAGIADAFEKLQPDLVVVLGDRFEILAAATAAAIMRIPIVHISGGEITLGAIDDKMRHAITKLSALHLTTTEAYRRRVISMGEDPATVVNVGALGVWNAMQRRRLSLEELSASLGADLSGRFALLTCHPVTAVSEDTLTPALSALESFPDLKILATYPNNDTGSTRIIERLERLAAEQPERVCLVRSLGMQRYISAASLAAVVMGNSSSGVVEVPSCGTPSIDIGSRQEGRTAGPSVIRCEATTQAVKAALSRALSPEMRRIASLCENPYYHKDTPILMADAILTLGPHLQAAKNFYDHDA